MPSLDPFYDLEVLFFNIDMEVVYEYPETGHANVNEKNESDSDKEYELDEDSNAFINTISEV